jgi:hypothetical protein
MLFPRVDVFSIHKLKTPMSNSRWLWTSHPCVHLSCISQVLAGLDHIYATLQHPLESCQHLYLEGLVLGCLVLGGLVL